MFGKAAKAQQMVLSLCELCTADKEGSELNSGRIQVKVGDISLTKSNYDKVQKLMKNWNMTVEELCRYSIVSIADTHYSESEQALLEYEPR